MRQLQLTCGERCGTAASPAHVHIGNLAAQTGASRFGETQPHMVFSKVESWSGAVQPADFDYLLAEPKGRPGSVDAERGEGIHAATEGGTLMNEPPFAFRLQRRAPA